LLTFTKDFFTGSSGDKASFKQIVCLPLK